MNLSEIRTIVRLHLESDNTEFPDQLVDHWIREGWLEAHRHGDWPFLDTTWELATALPATPFDRIRDIDGARPKDIRSVRVAEGELTPINPDTAQTMISFAVGGSLEYWATRGGRTLLIAPPPSEATDFMIQGYRAPMEWISDGDQATPDLPEDLHIALVYYALGRAFQRLDDPQSAIHHLDLYNAVLTSTATDLVSAQSDGDIVIGGGHGVRDRDVNHSPRYGSYSSGSRYYPNTRVIVQDAS